MGGYITYDYVICNALLMVLKHYKNSTNITAGYVEVNSIKVVLYTLAMVVVILVICINWIIILFIVLLLI